MNDDAAEELEAMAAIMGDDFSRSRDDTNVCHMYVAPELGENEEAVSLILAVTLPDGYPHTAEAAVKIASPHGYARSGDCFPHRATSSWTPSAAQIDDLHALLAEATADRVGDAVLFDCVNAARAWLGTNTLVERGSDDATDAALASRLKEAEVSDDDLELDEDDIDEEMIEALREVLRGGGELVRRLDKAEKMRSGSKEQKAALLAIWKEMSDAQRREMVASDSEDSDSSDDVPPAKASSSSKPAAPKQAPMPPPAQRGCKRGHTLTAVNQKPADYKKLDGNTGNCDICDADFRYNRDGGYHCDTCRHWDCCVRCGSSAATGSLKAAKSAKGGKRGKRK